MWKKIIVSVMVIGGFSGCSYTSAKESYLNVKQGYRDAKVVYRDVKYVVYEIKTEAETVKEGLSAPIQDLTVESTSTVGGSE